MKTCMCGCGAYLKNETSRYLLGHSGKGRVVSEETRSKMRAARGPSTKVDIVCLHCGNIFTVRKYRELEAKYCSASCRSKATYHKAAAGGFSGKGRTAWNKGIVLGYIPVGAFKKGMTPWNKGNNVRNRTYHSWRAMKERCDRPRNASYKHYGAQGVTYCDRWKDFSNFMSDMGERPTNTTLDRINPYGNYEAENCRWADPITQANNKRSASRALFAKKTHERTP